MPESYSFSPQFATIRSASPLEGMRPVKAIHTALQFQPQKFLEVKSEQPELVSNAWASGLKEGIGDALKGITTAYVDERKAKRQEKKENLDRFARIIVAQARGSKGTEDEEFQKEYKAAQLENLKSSIEARKNKKEDDDEEVNYGGLDDQTSMDATEVPEDNLPDDTIQLFPEDFNSDTSLPIDDLNGTLFAPIGPTQQEVGSLWSKPLSDLTANVDIQKQAGTLADMQAGNLTPTGASMSTDTQAPEKPASFNILSKNKSLVSPEEARRLQEEFYATTRELPTAFGALSTLPKPEQQQVLAEQKVDEQDLNRYFKTWGDPNVAIKAQKKIAEILGPEYNEAKIEQIKTKKGETGFKVLFPERKTDKELAEASKKPEKFKLLQAHLEKFNNIDSAEATLKDIQGVLSEVGNQSGPMVGRIRQLIGGVGYDSLAIRLNNLVDSLTPGLARGVFGEVGVLTDDDVRRYKALIPNIQRDPKVAQILMDDLLNTLKTRKKITIGNLDKAGYDIENFKVTEEVPESENLMDSARQLVGQIKQMPEGSDKEALKAQLREIQIKLKK